jgi:hypothetical protein
MSYRILSIAVLPVCAVVVGILSGCSLSLPPDNHRGAGVIAFEEFAVEIVLPDERHKFRMDGTVSDLDEHMQKVLREFDLTNAPIISTSPSTWGRTISWTGSDGVKWSISYVLADADERLTLARLAHEKYHALNRLSPPGVSAMHSAVEARGFNVDWNQYDEELRANIVQMASLHAQGVPLENIGGSEQALEALSILKAGRSNTSIAAPP